MESFRERFQRLVAPLSDTELAVALGVSADGARKMRRGDIKTLKLETALRLCDRLGIDPWELQYGRARAAAKQQVSDAETEARSPEDPVWEAIRLLREDVLDLKEAIESPGGAAESKPSKRHRGRRSA